METNKKDPGGLKDQRDQRTGNGYTNSTGNMSNNRTDKSLEKGSSVDRGKANGNLEKKPIDSSVHKEQKDQRTGTPGESINSKTPGARVNTGTPTTAGMSNSSTEKRPVNEGKPGGDMNKTQKDLFSQNDQKDQRTGSSYTPSAKGKMDSRNESLDKGTADRGSKPGVDKAVSSRDKADTIGRK